MNETTVVGILTFIGFLFVLAGWYQIIKHIKAYILGINLFIGLTILILLLILTKPGYWYWIPGMLIGGTIIPGLIFVSLLVWNLEDRNEDGMFPD